MHKIRRIGLGGSNPRGVDLVAQPSQLHNVTPRQIMRDNAAQEMLDRLTALQGRDGIYPLKQAFYRISTVPMLERLWRGQKPVALDRLMNIAREAEPFIAALQAEEAKVNWKPLGWEGPKPSEFLQARLDTWLDRSQDAGRSR